MIIKEDLFPIGQLLKPHGINGEITFNFTSDVFDTEDIEFLIIEIQGIFVPFYLEEYRFKSKEIALLKLDGIRTDEKARTLSGSTVYLQKKYLEKVQNTEIELDYFVGFTLIDELTGEIGVITEVDQTTKNALFVIGGGKNEMLIPVGEDYIMGIDHNLKRIVVKLPEGLLELS